MSGSFTRWLVAIAFAAMAATSADAACVALQKTPQLPDDLALCKRLDPVVRKPAALPLNEYEEALNQYFSHFCHRDPAAGWVRDKFVRDTGPYVASLVNGAWMGSDRGTHAPVVIWYSPEMLDWLKTARPSDEAARPAEEPPVPDGAMIVKEMYPAPAALCAKEDPAMLKPTSGAAFMVRDAKASHDGWYWGWYGWSDDPKANIDWPPRPSNGLPYQGFGQYCLNCHASAQANSTFSSLTNIEGEPGRPIAFLSQDFALDLGAEPHHEALTDVAPAVDDPKPAPKELNPDVAALFDYVFAQLPKDVGSLQMPSASYDTVWVKEHAETTEKSQYLTSDQCVGCHDAGSTGLQFDMTRPAPLDKVHNPDGSKLINMSPYGTWRNSPMGLAGRDPIFFSQLASETQTFHPDVSPEVQSICLGCHGIQGQRQFQLDGASKGGGCPNFERSMADAVPYPPNNPGAEHADFGALARDGISCTACHHAIFKDADIALAKDSEANRCIVARQDQLNPKDLAEGFARTFTGSYFVGAADRLKGPFEDPRQVPMKNALGIQPEHDETFLKSDLCGSCHTVHLPVLDRGKTLGYTFEQTTYPEWAFSDYRTGLTANGSLPEGEGPKAQSCQDCHMKSHDETGQPLVSKIASIQEHSNFPAAENALGPDAIDLERRVGFALHTLVGLNVFLIEMADQFPDFLGIAVQDPMLVSKGVDNIVTTRDKMLENAETLSASIAVTKVSQADGRLAATVKIASDVGHKFPSGVGFRRAFVEFRALDAAGKPLWTSGGTNAAGVIVDGKGEPLPGELWWEPNCSARVAPLERRHQPHYQTITSESEAQIYQELVSTPAPSGEAMCGHDAAPAGQLTTSFLSICSHVKDNRILPSGYLPFEERVKIANALGSKGTALAEDTGSVAVGDDPDYVTGGGDTLDYEIDLASLDGQVASVEATLYYQAIPPFYLQDRFCTAKGTDRDRLAYLTSQLDLDDTAAAGWKLKMVSSGPVAVGD
ncbi:cytochrome P460 family protein [Jiella avicenniae]|uniref:Cytochrome P460 family protein n=1 Tax=Jiella avicenniae TaxID=2907202 RepID=A0A9X1NYM6_9HYPH|nr:cytochrome P460 family protein [Jiella avicenniae]MCE7027278.1 cytochrome P460 family protein [Jiella avicenniae]